MRGKDTTKYLQEQVVTERNGRYVLMVRAEHRGNVPGIVHGSSASGASLFLEPSATVEINNDIVELEEREREEIRRILLELTDAFRAAAGRPAARRSTSPIELDVLQAKARFGSLVNGVAPEIAIDGRLELRARTASAADRAPVPATRLDGWRRRARTSRRRPDRRSCSNRRRACC